MVNELCDEDVVLPDISKRELDIRMFEPLKIGYSREMLKEEYVLEASYNKDYEKVKKERERERKNRVEKRNIRVYGYKYHKVLQFIA